MGETRDARAVMEWATARDAQLQARGGALIRVADGLTQAHAAGHQLTREDLLVALVRMTALTADTMSLSRQVVEACDAALSARPE